MPARSAAENLRRFRGDPGICRIGVRPGGRSGVSLLEALFSLLVSFMALTAVTFVLQQAVAAGGTLDEQGTTAEVYHAFSQIRRDIASALLVRQPGGANEAEILLDLVDPELSFATRSADGQPFASDEQIQIRYSFNAGVLWREVLRASVVLDRRRVLACRDFSTGLSQGLVSVRISVPQRRLVKFFQMECRIRPG